MSDAMAARLTALAALYTDESNWVVNDGGNFWNMNAINPRDGSHPVMQHVSIMLEGHGHGLSEL
jgi:hypothetical protein